MNHSLAALWEAKTSIPHLRRFIGHTDDPLLPEDLPDDLFDKGDYDDQIWLVTNGDC